MPRFMFSLAKTGVGSESGAVVSDSFSEALTVLAQQPQVTVGDTLEIGVPGFPPARYECIALGTGPRQWMPTSQLAA